MFENVCSARSSKFNVLRHKSWTVLLYVHADNDLGNAAVDDLLELSKSFSFSRTKSIVRRLFKGLPVRSLPRFNSRTTRNRTNSEYHQGGSAKKPFNGVHLVVLLDRSVGKSTKLLKNLVQCHNNSDIIPATEFGQTARTLELYSDGYTDKGGNDVEANNQFLVTQDHGELDMTSSSTLSQFIGRSLYKYPADEYGLILWNHGSSWQGLGQDVSSPRGHMSLSAIKGGIQGGITQASRLSDGRIDKDRFRLSFIGVDACLMSDYTVIDSLSGLADVIGASEENEAASGWDWRYFQLMNHFHNGNVYSAGEIMLSIMTGYSRLRGPPNVTMALVVSSEFQEMDKQLRAFFSYVASFGAEILSSLIDDTISQIGIIASCAEIGLCHCYDFGQFLHSLTETVLKFNITEEGGTTTTMEELQFRHNMSQQIHKLRMSFIRSVPYVLGDNQIFSPLEKLKVEGITNNGVLPTYWMSSRRLPALSGVSFYFPHDLSLSLSSEARAIQWAPFDYRQKHASSLSRAPSLCSFGFKNVYNIEFENVWSYLFRVIDSQRMGNSDYNALTLESADMGHDRDSTTIREFCPSTSLLIESAKSLCLHNDYFPVSFCSLFPNTPSCVCNIWKGQQGDGWTCSKKVTLVAAVFVPLIGDQMSDSDLILQHTECLARQIMTPNMSFHSKWEFKGFTESPNSQSRQILGLRFTISVDSDLMPKTPPVDFVYLYWNTLRHTAIDHPASFISNVSCGTFEGSAGEMFRKWTIEKIVVRDRQWHLSPDALVHMLTMPFPPHITRRIHRDGLAFLIVSIGFLLSLILCDKFGKLVCRSRKS